MKALHAARVGTIAIAVGLLAAHLRAQESDAPVRDKDRTFSRYVISWKDLKFRGVVQQQRDYSCGAAALATVLRFGWGEAVNEAVVLQYVERLLTPAELADRAQLGLTMTDLRKTAVEMGYEAVIGRLEVADLYTTKVPLIVAIRLQTGLDHFVVFRGIIGGQVYLADPFRGNVRMPVDDFTKQWIDNAVVVVARPGETEPPNNQLVVRWDEASTQGLRYQYIRTRPERTFLPTVSR